MSLVMWLALSRVGSLVPSADLIPRLMVRAEESIASSEMENGGPTAGRSVVTMKDPPGVRLLRRWTKVCRLSEEVSCLTSSSGPTPMKRRGTALKDHEEVGGDLDIN